MILELCIANHNHNHNFDIVFVFVFVLLEIVSCHLYLLITVLESCRTIGSLCVFVSTLLHILTILLKNIACQDGCIFLNPLQRFVFQDSRINEAD